MNEKLSYEEKLNQSWDDLLLPGEDMAWKDMKRRLDEDDDDKIVVPPPRRGCGIGALLVGLLILIGFWFLLRPDKWFMKNESETAQQTKVSKEQQKVKVDDKVNSPEKSSEKDKQPDQNADTVNKKETVIPKDNSENTSLPNENKHENETEVEIKTKEASVKKNKPVNKRSTGKEKDQTRLALSVNSKVKKGNNKKEPVLDKAETQPEKNIVTDKTKPDSIANITGQNIKENGSIEDKKDQPPVVRQKDSTTLKQADSVVVKKTDQPKSETTPPKKKDKEKIPIFFSAGIGLHQQIPIAGQEWTTYGSLGRKGILTDYIPSINFRMEKKDRWFLQTEFRYGAPQHTKQLTYSQKISIDTITQVVTTNSSSLKKTFYHQVPLTFSYYVLPNWSVGTGFQWNKFFSAVAEQGITRRRPGTTTDSVLSKSIVKVSNDSSTALVKSWWQGVVQTQYQWKRFSIGARYSFGLQPYIKFTLPNQPLQEEKHSSFQLFLRYELWRSKK